MRITYQKLRLELLYFGRKIAGSLHMKVEQDLQEDIVMLRTSMRVSQGI